MSINITMTMTRILKFGRAGGMHNLLQVLVVQRHCGLIVEWPLMISVIVGFPWRVSMTWVPSSRSTPVTVNIDCDTGLLTEVHRRDERPLGDSSLSRAAFLHRNRLANGNGRVKLECK